MTSPETELLLRESATILIAHADRLRELYPAKADEILQRAAHTLDRLDSGGAVADLAPEPAADPPSSTQAHDQQHLDGEPR